MSIWERIQEWAERMAEGQSNYKLHCPHCNKGGYVKTKQIQQKTGISGAKATGAILTGGVSLLATGLAKKEWITQARCSNCGSTWTIG